MSAFKVIIRIVFLFAYGAFLYASLRHIAYFFANFEPAGTDWTGAYALAISIDATILILSIGMMFFRKDMSRWALTGIWVFILGLAAFSLIVNWEYAVQFQSNGLSKATSFWWLNPILASSFALLNVAYSLVADLFNSEQESVEELQQKLENLKQTSRLKQELAALKNQQQSSYIAGKIQMFKDAVSPEDASPIYEQTTDKLGADVQIDSLEIEDQTEVKITPIVAQISVLEPASQFTKPSQYFMSFEEAVRYTGYAEVTLRKQLKSGEIEANGKGDKLKVSTLRIRTGHTSQMPIVKVDKIPATNGHY